MRRPIFKLLAAFCVAAVLLVVVVLVVTLSQPIPPPPPLPNPNGYDDFVAAGKMIPADAADYRTMTTNELSVYVQQNAEALKLVRSGLSHACRVPETYSPTNTDYLQNLSYFKRLGLALAAQGQFAESENREEDAADAYLTAIRLGQESSRGGLIMNSLVGIAVESIGVTRIEGALANLNAKQCRDLASALESVESHREPPQTTLEDERQWSRRTWGFKGQLARLITYKSIRQSEKKWMSRATAQQVRTRNLIVALASRAYELDKGQPPPTIASLVPEYLKAVPQVSSVSAGSTNP